jgi:hypothetical protein
MLEDKLREEIIQSQIAQNSLTKWKLGMIAAIGAAGVGALNQGKAPREFVVLWGLIPFVCLYTDIVCYHVGVRVVVIARYFRLRQNSDSYKNLLYDLNPGDRAGMRLFDDYEWFCVRNRHQFLLEGIAIMLVSVVISAIIAIAGWFLPLQPKLLPPTYATLIGGMLFWSGTGGVLTTMLAYRVHRQRTSWLDTAPVDAPRPNVFKTFFGLWPRDEDLVGYREINYAKRSPITQEPIVAANSEPMNPIGPILSTKGDTAKQYEPSATPFSADPPASSSSTTNAPTSDSNGNGSV